MKRHIHRRHRQVRPPRSFEPLENRLALAAEVVLGTFGDPLPTPHALTTAGDMLYFNARNPDLAYTDAIRLWRTDGTQAGTISLMPSALLGYSPQRLTAVGDRLYFTFSDQRGRELWSSDGTAVGTRIVADIHPGPSGPGPAELTAVGDRLFFAAGWWNNVELWMSDGTQAGTRQVAELDADGSSAPRNLVDFNGVAFFTADNGSEAHGRELWRSDGTPGGTWMVKDINPGGAGLNESTWNDSIEMVAVGNTLFFTATDGVHGRELWTTDGTPEGTSLVKDMLPGDLSSQPYNLVRVGEKLYFTAYNVEHGRELWSSDGTEVGTAIVRDIEPGPVSGGGLWFTPKSVAGDSLYFTRNVGGDDIELWVTNGTESGTVLVREFDDRVREDFLAVPRAGGGYDFFFEASDDPTVGPALWKTDGTAAGTVKVFNDLYGDRPEGIGGLTYFDDHFYFSDSGYGSYTSGNRAYHLRRSPVVNVGPPVVTVNGPFAIAEGQSLTLSATATDPDPVNVLTYGWDINGDGVFTDALGESPTLSWHELTLLGLDSGPNWQAVVRVHDGNGGETVSAPVSLSIATLPPVVTGMHLNASQGRDFATKFTGLGDLPGGIFASYGTAISDDGRVIVGYGTSESSIAEAFRWTATTGLVTLGLPDGDRYGVLTDLSADGSVAVGYGMSSYSVDEIYGSNSEVFTQLRNSSYSHPVRWTAEMGFVRLGAPEGSFGGETPAAVSADGAVTVGVAYWDDGYLGVQWNDAGQARLIGGPELWGGEPGGPAYAVSADGSIAYGQGQTYGDIAGQVFRWTLETGAMGLGIDGRPVATSRDGSVVVGNVLRYDSESIAIFIMRPDECAPDEPPEPPTTTAGLGGTCTGGATILLNDGPRRYTATDASADASMIVGRSDDGAFIWDAQHGFRLVADVLRDQGYVLDHWTLTAATGVSADGTVLVGYGTNPEGNPEAWRADLSAVVLAAVGSGEQLRPIGQVGIDEVSISFSEHVTVAADNLVVAGGNVDRYEVSQFAYDPATQTAVWRLAQPIAADAVQITLESGEAGVRDAAGLALDGEWDNPISVGNPSSDTFPSGDGSAGGDFVFRFSVLPSDVDGDGAVGRRDLALLVQQGFRRQGDPGFNSRFDVDGDGVIGALDAMFARDHLGDILPAFTASPAAVRVQAAGADGGSRRITASRQRAVAAPDRVDAAIIAEVSTSTLSTSRSTRRTR